MSILIPTVCTAANMMIVLRSPFLNTRTIVLSTLSLDGDDVFEGAGSLWTSPVAGQIGELLKQQSDSPDHVVPLDW